MMENRGSFHRISWPGSLDQHELAGTRRVADGGNSGSARIDLREGSRCIAIEGLGSG